MVRQNNYNKLKIAVAMSGGVDSAAAAKLLYDQGHKVTGIFLHFWHEELNNPPNSLTAPSPSAWFRRSAVQTAWRQGGKIENKCCSGDAWLSAEAAAHKIGIPIYSLNFSGIFKKQVVADFLSEYGRGRTPNPCVRCNKLVKLGFLIKQAKKLGFDRVASGHYARLRREFSIFPPLPRLRRASNFQFSNNKNNKFICKLYKAKDKNKDQSYFLYRLNQNELKRLIFPLGDYTKKEVRELAKKFGLNCARRRDSQEICFVPEKNHNEFLKRHLKLKPGPIKLLYENNAKTSLAERAYFKKSLNRAKMKSAGIMGYHQGLPLYTIGQRKGLNLGAGGPYYVAKKHGRSNILYVVAQADQKKIYSRSLRAKKVNWLSGREPNYPLICRAKARYNQIAAACAVKKTSRGNYEVKFIKPVRAIASGQSVVFYKKNQVLGGGVMI